jgi:hypothetical protein
VTIADVQFDFEPAGAAAEDYQPAPRGTDARIGMSGRARAGQRLAAKKARRDTSDPISDDLHSDGSP